MRVVFLLMLVAHCLLLPAQVTVTENKQHAFADSVPPGNYSGIAWLGGNLYAVVSDKSEEDGFFVFEIDTDTLSGEILAVRNRGFRSSGFKGRDDEGIAHNPHTNTIMISGEEDNRILEYNMDGVRTLREAELPPRFRNLPFNLGLEALSYNHITHTLWTCNESDTIYLQSFDDSLKPLCTYRYLVAQPRYDRTKARNYAHGIGTICALDDGSLLLLERELFVTHSKLGSSVICKLFRIVPGDTAKELVAEWKTDIGLFSRSFANYEGMCLGPTLHDGSRVLLLVADSQNQYGGVLKDWFKSFKLSY